MDWSGVVIVAVVGVTVGWIGLSLRRVTVRPPKASAPKADPPKAPSLPQAATPPAPPRAPASPISPDEPLATKLDRISRELSPRAEASAHPRELTEWPEFQAAVDAFAGPEISLGVLRQYAFGANWPLACAAFAALARHPEGNLLFPAVLAQLPRVRPWSIYFALEYFTALDLRPPVGAPVVPAPEWWAANLVIPDLFREHFAAREALGDEPSFDDYLESSLCAAPQHVATLLQRVEHPFAQSLLEELRRWQGMRIDHQFLASFGRFWDTEARDPLLVAPAAWTEQLDHAASTVRHSPPRSLVVTGEARIGKTSFLKLLAARMRADGWRIFEAGGAELQADQVYIGQLEGRIRKLVEELDARKKVAWYVTDLVQIAESGTHRGQSASILDQILPAIVAGRLVVLGEASPAGAVRLMQMRPSLRSLIEICRLQPMSEDEAAALAGGVAGRLERELNLKIGPAAVATALELSQHYLGTSQLPGVLIELVKRSARTALAARAQELTPENVLVTVAQITGLPRSILDDKERIELRTIRGFLGARVMGQAEAVDAVVDRIAMLKAGLVDPRRPIGVFLFAGPTGTGKTELAKALAEYLFGAADRMARLDMSEFQTAEATVKILGSRGDGAQTDLLTEKVRKQPFSVILLDEFEKAHANTWDLFLQIFDDGRLADANGRVADFRHTFIIMTSNLGATSHRGSGMGFVPDPGVYGEDQVLRAVGQTFRPEFVNRLDKIVVFRPLSRDLMRTILRKELNGILERRGLRRRDWAVEWEASAIEFLLDRGFSPEMGARPLKRAIDQHLLAPLAASMVEHRFPEGDQFLFVRSNGKALQVEFVDPDGEAIEAAPAREVEPDTEVSLAAMIMRPYGTAAERAALAARAAEITGQLAGAEWNARKEQLQAETTAPDIWSRPDRPALFARLVLMERVGEAARTAERLMLRLDTSRKGTAHASRELVARLALQLHLVQAGLADAALGAPVDVLLMVEPALDAAADATAQATWCGRLTEMYRHWAARRRMQLDEYAPPRGRAGPTILQVSGFGAFRTLASEAGLHILEDPELDEGRRTAARVKAVAGPLREPRATEAYRDFAERLSEARDASAIVRRYRVGPSPLVRDARGWRSGRLEAVLGGDFDLIGALPR